MVEWRRIKKKKIKNSRLSSEKEGALQGREKCQKFSGRIVIVCRTKKMIQTRYILANRLVFSQFRYFIIVGVYRP